MKIIAITIQNLTRSILYGFGQVVFQSRPSSGLLCLLAAMLPGLCGPVSGLVSGLASRALVVGFWPKIVMHPATFTIRNIKQERLTNIAIFGYKMNFIL